MRKIIFAVLFMAAFAVNAADLQINATAPTMRTDSTPITGVLTYNLYYSIDNSPRPVVNLTDPSYTLTNVQPGTYTFQMSASEDGLEGPLSDPVTKIISAVAAAQPGKVVITVDFSGCNGCGLQAK